MEENKINTYRPRKLANDKELIASKGFLAPCFSLKYLESPTKSVLNPSCGIMLNLHKIKFAASIGGKISKLLVPRLRLADSELRIYT